MYKKAFSTLVILFCVIMFFITLGICVLQKKYSQQNFIHNIETVVEETFAWVEKKTGYTWFNEIYGIGNIILSPNEIVNSGRIVKDEDGYLEPISYITFDITNAEKKIYELSQICAQNGTEFSYISYPSKSNAETKSGKYGIETNQEEMRSSFLNGLDSYGINVLDVRQLLESDGYTAKDIFYKTDHHWKSTAGFYSAAAIVNYLNETYDYSLRSDLLDKSLFSFTTYNDLWFGETGRKCSITWVGTLDDFTEILPTYNTSLRMGKQYGEYDKEGDFSMMIWEPGYNGNIDLYSYSAHYSYGIGIGSPTWIHNDNVNGKKILIIKDSFSMVVIPFLSLATSDIAVWDMRATPEGLYDYIADNNFDVVLIAYTDFWQDNMYNFK